jgi:hypothetical protein
LLIEDRAAITIQKFFQMVKMEVDRAIRAEKKKRLKTRDTVTTSSPAEGEGRFQTLKMIVFTTLQNNGGETPASRSGKPMNGIDMNRKSRSSQSQGVSVLKDFSSDNNARPRKNDTVILTSRRHWDKDDDNASVASYYSTTSSQFKVPISRMRLSEKEMDDTQQQTSEKNTMQLRTATNNTMLAFLGT